MKRIIAFFMAAVMVLALVGCGKNDKTDKEETKAEETKVEAIDIVGTWTMDTSYAEMMKIAIGIENEFSCDITLKMEWNFGEDGKLVIHNATDYSALDEKVVKTFSAELADYMLEASVREQGLTLEEYSEALKAQGTTLDAVRTELYDQFVTSFSGPASADELDVENTYKVEGNKVIIDDGSSFTLDVKDNTAVIGNVEGDNVGVLFEGAILTKKVK